MTAFTRTDSATAELTLHLTRLGLTAPDLGSALHTIVTDLTAHTAATGAAYYQRAATGVYEVRASCGSVKPRLPTALVQALDGSPDLLSTPDTLPGTPPACMAAPVRDRHGALIGALIACGPRTHFWSSDERALLRNVTGMITLLAARLDAEERERDAHESALRALGLCLEARDADLQGHTHRVTALALQVGRAMQLSTPELAALRWGASLHDIGKLSLPDEILHHAGPLSPVMRQRMRQHVDEGLRLAQQLSFFPLEALDVIAAHHERWDGHGYPHGKSGAEIPLIARIFAACDVFDALTSPRSYKSAWTSADALSFVQSSSGTHFDPQVVQALTDVLMPASA